MDEKLDPSRLEKEFPAMHKFLNPNNDNEALDNFLKRVTEIESIIKDLSASDKITNEDGLDRAEKYLKKAEEQRRLKEEAEGKTKFSHTVLNRNCLKDSYIKIKDNSDSSMSHDAFMSLMERDAAARAARRKQRESEK